MYVEDVSSDLLAITHDDTLSDIQMPSTHEEATRSGHASRWRESMGVEMQDLLKHDTWELTRNSTRAGFCENDIGQIAKEY